jgi:hypothetical protein
VTVNGTHLTKGDGAAITGEDALRLTGRGADFVIWNLPE